MPENEQYIVSARKYRPQSFDTVIGQQHITTTLKNAIRTNHLAHAYLFCGPRGVGKTTCARILARTLNCEHPTESMEACGVCDTCRAFQTNSAFNIFELDAASNNSVDDIRRLTEQVRYAPQHGKYKIYIIDEVHMLSSAAFNAFLKTLEEPPSYAIFILATTEKHKILPTILSRCQIFDFRRIKPKEIVHHLEDILQKEGLSAEEAALHIIAQKSEGCMRDALSMMDRLAGFSGGNLSYAEVIEHLNILDATAYFKLCEMLWVKDIAGALLWLDGLLQKGFEGDLILNGLSEHFRDLLLCKEARMAKLLDLPEVHKKRFYEHAQMLSESYALSALSLLNEAELNYKNALNRRLHVELCLMKLCYLNDLVSPGAVAGSAEVKKKLKQHNDQPEEQPAPAMPPPPEPQPDIPEAAAEHEKEQEIPPAPDRVQETPPVSSPPAAVPELKISKNYLKDLQEQVNQEEQPEPLTLSQDLVVQLFDEFKVELRKTKSVPLAEQMDMMVVAFQSADELHLLCTSEINYSYGKTVARKFRLYVRRKTGQQTLRVKPVLDPEAQPEAPKPQIKSKQEILEEMMIQNPILRALKKELNLTIEY